MFEELLFIVGFVVFSAVISHILLNYSSGLVFKIINIFFILSIIFHGLFHRLMWIATRPHIKDAVLLRKKEAERNRDGQYWGGVYLKTNKVTFVQAFIVGFAPIYLSFWSFVPLLDVVVNSQLNLVILILFWYIIISLFLSATPSSADLTIIYDGFKNDIPKSLYQILLITFSILITWNLSYFFHLQFPHEIFDYLLIVAFYFIFKRGFKIIRHKLSSINVKKHEFSSLSKSIFKKFARSKCKLSKYLRKKPFHTKNKFFKKKLRKKKRDKLIEGNEVVKIENPAKILDKKSAFKNEALYKILPNEIVENFLEGKSHNFKTNIKKPRKSINYKEYLKVVNERDDLIVSITPDQFKIVMEKNNILPPGNRLRRSHVKLPWKCKAENHEFFASYSKIKNIGQKCPKCQKITYENYLELVNIRPDLIIGMHPDQFKIVMEENDILSQKERVRPSYVKLLWTCKAKGDKWSTSYHNIKAGTKCPYCSATASVTYENYLEVVKERPDLIVELSEAEFNKIIADNNRLPENIRKSPSHIHNLKWKCKAERHKFHASYSKIKNEGKECPECRKILYTNYLELVNARPDLVFYMTSDQFKIVMEENDMLSRKERLRPSRVRLPWKCKLKKHTWLSPYNNIKQGHGCPFCGEQAKVIGLSSHPIIEYYSLKFLIDLKKCQVKYEEIVTQDRRFRPDLLINRNTNFRINIEQLQSIIWFPSKIRIVAVDITFGLNIIGILDKCYRQYQSEDSYLLIVMMRERNGSNVEIIQKLIQEAHDINKKEHINVINFKEYLEFLGLRKNINDFRSPSEAEKEIVTRFRWAKKLTLASFESETEFKKLIKAGKLHSDLISKYK